MDNVFSDSALQVLTFGQLQVKYHGRDLTFRINKARDLFIYLLYEGGKNHGRDELATYLWPEENEGKVRENFRQVLYQLRRPFGAEAKQYFTITRATVRFNTNAPHWFDAALFEQAIHQQDWTTAVALYRGEFLANLHFDETVFLADWLHARRTQFEQGMLRGLAELAQQGEQAGNTAVVEKHAHHILQISPWHEEAHRMLMRTYARRGQRSQSLAQYEYYVESLATELGLAPTAETETLYQQIRTGAWPPTSLDAADIPVAPPARRHNLPLSLTPLIGRQAEQTQIQRLINQPDCLLLTILGPGGIGKTRLLQSVGWALHGQKAESEALTANSDGIFFISLLDLPAASVNKTDLELEEAIASLIFHELEDVPPASHSPRKTWTELLVAWLRPRRVTLLLDNWEEFVSGATVLTRLLTAVAHLKIITTSREPLRLAGEWLFELHGLNRPTSTSSTNSAQDSLKEIEMFAAPHLFLQAARRQQPNFQPTSADLAQIVTICHALEGHPLALELAASWLRGLTLSELTTSVTEGLDLLTSTAPSIAPRHQNLRHVLAYSWARLIPSQQQALAQLALFRQAFTSQIAVAVTQQTPHLLAELVQRTWLRRLDDGRYEYHELLRHFAAEQLRTQPDLYQMTLTRYIQNHLADLATLYTMWQTKVDARQVTVLRHRWADMEQAWWGAVEQQMWPELTASVGMVALYHRQLGMFSAGLAWLKRTIEKTRPWVTPAAQAADPHKFQAAQRALAQLLVAQANLHNTQVTSTPVPALMQEAAQLATAMNDFSLWLRAQSEWVMGLTRLGQFDQARTKGEQILADLPPDYPVLEVAPLWFVLGGIAVDSGELIRAEKYFRQKLRIDEEHGLIHQAAATRHNLAICLSHLGQYKEARRLFRLELCYRMQANLPPDNTSQEGLGYLYIQQGKLTLASLHLRSALRGYEKLEDLDGMAYSHLYLGHVAGAREQWRRAARHYGEALRLRQVLDHAYLFTQCWVGLAEAAWRQGDLLEAQAQLQNGWPTLAAGAVTGEDVSRTYWVAYEVYTAVGQPKKAATVLAQGVAYVRQQADALADNPIAQHIFLNEIAAHRALLAAV